MVVFPLEESALRIGSRVLPSRYILAPLAGYTHLAFRRVLRELGGLGLATTDLVHATQLLEEHPKSMELVVTDDDDRPLSVQIFGSDPEVLARAARWLEDRGYEGVDLNMGCPMAKVNGQGGGARLACQFDAACGLVERVIASVRIPVTVKMRLGWDRDCLTAPALAAEFERLGVAAVTIHGRTRQQGFSGTVDLDGIREVVRAVKSTPVIGNGDVRSVDDAACMRRVTGCAGIAIGRGAMLDPWLFRRIELASRGQPHDFETAPEEQVEFLRRHFTLMVAQHGDYSCRLFRKFAAWYGARLGIPDDLEHRLRLFESVTEFHVIADEILRRHGQRQRTIATALIKVPNGPVERW